ncbi:MAG: flagellar M-ring protein FliF [Holosporales bacterium]|nr:flagellar M-ring protein FliF [Holosporales bacterium]
MDLSVDQKRNWRGFLKDWHKIPSLPLWASITIGILLLVSLFFFVGQNNDKRILFTDLDLSESAKITARLESLSIPFETCAEGQQILVRAEDIARARIGLAEEGLPTGGMVGYELFDKSETFGATSFVQKVNHTRALEGELARSIVTLQPVARARVHLVLPPKALFSTEKQNPSASVVLKLKTGAHLRRPQIQAIQNLVASAVPDLTVEGVTIVDDQGALLTSAHGGDSRNGMAHNFEEMRVSHEARLAHNIETLLARTVGLGKVRVEVAIDMDFDHFQESKEIFDPDGQVVRSQQTIEDGANSEEHPDKTRGVTVENALPHDNTNAKIAAATGNVSQTKKTEEILNYEISRTTQSLVREAGVIRRISVAVLVDGIYKKGENGEERVYSPRGKVELDKLQTLVKSAMGFRAERGDTVEVVNLRFAKEENTEGSLDVLAAEEQGNLLWILLLLLIVLIIAFLIWYLMQPHAFFKEHESSEGLQQQDLLLMPNARSSVVELEDLASRVRKFIDEDPETAAAIIENWLQQEA